MKVSSLEVYFTYWGLGKQVKKQYFIVISTILIMNHIYHHSFSEAEGITFIQISKGKTD